MLQFKQRNELYFCYVDSMINFFSNSETPIYTKTNRQRKEYSFKSKNRRLYILQQINLGSVINQKKHVNLFLTLHIRHFSFE